MSKSRRVGADRIVHPGATLHAICGKQWCTKCLSRFFTDKLQWKENCTKEKRNCMPSQNKLKLKTLMEFGVPCTRGFQCGSVTHMQFSLPCIAPQWHSDICSCSMVPQGVVYKQSIVGFDCELKRFSMSRKRSRDSCFLFVPGRRLLVEPSTLSTTTSNAISNNFYSFRSQGMSWFRGKMVARAHASREGAFVCRFHWIRSKRCEFSVRNAFGSGEFIRCLARFT